MRHSPIKRPFAFILGAFVAALASAQTQDVPVNVLQPQALDYAGINSLQALDPSLIGTGVTVAVISRSTTYIDGQPLNDYTPARMHNCFAGTRFVFHDNRLMPTGFSQHTTSVCSILFGRDGSAYNDRLGFFPYQGIVPEAEAHIYELWHFITDNIFTASPPRAQVITASFGTQFEDWWTRGFDSIAQHKGIVIVASIGNGCTACDTVLYPGAGANVIGVGVVRSLDTEDMADSLRRFTLADPQRSSAGPTSDSRTKPDIVAPANCLVADSVEPNLYRPAGDWSSFSAPVVAGAAALLVQAAQQHPELNPAVLAPGGNAVVKALLLNSAVKLPFWHKGKLSLDDDHQSPLDFVQGAGRLDALGAYNNLVAGRFTPGNCPVSGWNIDKLDLDRAPGHGYRITIEQPGGKSIAATACWNRQFAGAYPFEPATEKDIDLRLEIWAVDPNNSERDYLLDYSDSRLDNIEHIWRQADPNFTQYEIIIAYSQLPDPAFEEDVSPYALAWNVVEQPVKDDVLNYDLTGDGVIDDADVTALIGNVLAAIEQPDGYFLGDINADGLIDADDLGLLIERFSGNDADRSL